MIQLILVLAGFCLLLSIMIFLGGFLLSAGFYSKDYDFFKAMQKIKNWEHQTSSITNMLENKNTMSKV